MLPTTQMCLNTTMSCQKESLGRGLFWVMIPFPEKLAWLKLSEQRRWALMSNLIKSANGMRKAKIQMTLALRNFLRARCSKGASLRNESVSSSKRVAVKMDLSVSFPTTWMKTYLLHNQANIIKKMTLSAKFASTEFWHQASSLVCLTAAIMSSV